MDREDTIEALKKECERLRITRLDARRRAKRFKHAWQTEKSKVRSAEDQARMQKDLLDKICESVGGVVTASIRINRLQKTQDRLFHENDALQAECEALREALEDISGTHHHSASAGEYFAKVARKALAAYRKRGG